MLRVFDLVISILGLLLCFPLMLLLYVACYLDTRKPLFRQKRVGRFEKTYTLYKFRTMSIGTKDLPTHEIGRSQVTPLGRFLRSSKLDELPQMFNVFLGDMSFVGPRPCLPSQSEVINERRKLGVYGYRPGITGLSQLSGIDMSTPKLLADSDLKMLKSLGLAKYFEYIVFTAMGRGFGDSVK